MAPPYPDIYQVEFWFTNPQFGVRGGGTSRALLATKTLAVGAHTVCALDAALTAEPLAMRVGDRVTLSWCDPSFSAVQTSYRVSSYTVYASRSPNGPFNSIMEVQGAANTTLSIPTDATGTLYYFVQSHGCLAQLCAPGASNTTRQSNVTAVSVAPLAGCLPSATTLCLQNGRFETTALFWTTGANELTSAHAVPLTDQSGYFWFFSAENVELTLKVLNACPSSFWVFASGMTNVGVEIQVRDTKTGVSRTISNVRGSPFTPIQDTNAFDCP